MKILFSIIAGSLVVAYALLMLSFPTQLTDVPVLYWTTDPAPARQSQLAGFTKWQMAHGDTTALGRPVVAVDIDANNSGESKTLIQGVSGVASDLIDVRTSLGELGLYQASGILKDVTRVARKRGFSPEATWPALRSQLTVHNRQFLFPANANVNLLWVNKDAFDKHHVPLACLAKPDPAFMRNNAAGLSPEGAVQDHTR